MPLLSHRVDGVSPLARPRRRRIGLAAVTAAAAVAALLTPAWLHGEGSRPSTTSRAETETVQDEASAQAQFVQVADLDPAARSTRYLGHGSRGVPLSHLVYTPSVYPVRDGYRDTFTVSVTSKQWVAAKLVVRDSRHRVVRTVRASHGAGRLTLRWNGHLGNGRTALAGTYRWNLVWRDHAHNYRISASRTLTVSHRYLVSRHASYTLDGNRYWRAGGSDPACSQASAHGSAYARGVWLSNQCTGAIAAAFYRVHLPKAVSYSAVSVQVAGFTDHAGTRVYRAFGRDGAADTFDSGAFVTLADRGHRAWSFGSARTAHHVSRDGYLVLALSVDDRPAGARDLDIASVRTTVSYRALN